MNYRKFDGHQITPGAITKVQSITRTVVDTEKPKVFDSYPDYTVQLSNRYFVLMMDMISALIIKHCNIM